MLNVAKSETFAAWYASLRDINARGRIDARIRRLALGNAGDVRHVGSGLSELRVDYGPGYRVYYMQRGAELVVLLAGGDKRTQAADIKLAKRLAKDWR